MTNQTDYVYGVDEAHGVIIWSPEDLSLEHAEKVCEAMQLLGFHAEVSSVDEVLEDP